MDLREMILEVRSALDDQTERMWSDSEITRWLNQAVRIMCSQALPLQAVFSTTTTTGVQEYALPDDVIRVFSAAFFNGRMYQLKPADFVGAQAGSYVAGISSHFYLRNRTLHQAPQESTNTSITVSAPDPNKKEKAHMVLGLLPVPSSASQLLVYYFSRSQQLKNDGDEAPIPEEFHDGICAYAIGKGKEKDQAYEEGQIYMARFKDHMDALKNNFLLDGQDMGFPCVTVPDDFEYVSDGLTQSRFILPS